MRIISGVFDLETGSKSGFPSIKSDIEMFLETDDINSYKNIDNFSVVKNITGDFQKTFVRGGEVDWLYSESYIKTVYEKRS